MPAAFWLVFLLQKTAPKKHGTFGCLGINFMLFFFRRLFFSWGGYVFFCDCLRLTGGIDLLRLVVFTMF